MRSEAIKEKRIGLRKQLSCDRETRLSSRNRESKTRIVNEYTVEKKPTISLAPYTSYRNHPSLSLATMLMKFKNEQHILPFRYFCISAYHLVENDCVEFCKRQARKILSRWNPGSKLKLTDSDKEKVWRSFAKSNLHESQREESLVVSAKKVEYTGGRVCLAEFFEYLL